MSLLVVILRKRPVEGIDSSFFLFFLLFCGRSESVSADADPASDNNVDTPLGFGVSVSVFCEAKSQPFQTSLI